MLKVTTCDGGIHGSKRGLVKAVAAKSGLCCGNLWELVLLFVPCNPALCLRGLTAPQKHTVPVMWTGLQSFGGLNYNGLVF